MLAPWNDSHTRPVLPSNVSVTDTSQSHTLRVLPSDISTPTSTRTSASLATPFLATATTTAPPRQSLLDQFKSGTLNNELRRQAKTAEAAGPVPLKSLFQSMNEGIARLEAAQAAGDAPQSEQSHSDKLHKKQRQDAITKQQLRIQKAQQRIDSLTYPSVITQQKPHVTVKVSARALEKKIALLTNDKDAKALLKHGSTKIQSEEVSEDEPDEAVREQGALIACHNVMNPKHKIPLRNADGYTNCAFVKNEAEGSSDDTPESDEIDDDTSPDYAEHSQERTLSKEEWEQWQASKRAPSLSTEVPALLTAILGSQKSQKSSHDGRLQVALNPPPHGEWDDVNNNMHIIQN